MEAGLEAQLLLGYVPRLAAASNDFSESFLKCLVSHSHETLRGR